MDRIKLSKEEIEEMMDEYYNSDLKVSQILANHNVNILPGKLLSLFPPIESDDKCPYCNVPLIAKRPSRSYPKIHKSDYFCPQCGHRNMDRCCCDGCQERQQQERDQAQKVIRTTYPKQPNKSLADLSLEDMINFGALCMCNLSSDMTTFGPVGYYTSITPAKDWDRELLSEINKKGFISVSGLSPVEAFNPDVFPFDYDPRRVVYDINLDPADVQLIIDGRQPDLSVETNLLEVKSIWRKINKSLIYNYLLMTLASFNFSFSPGDKTKILIETMLDHFALSQSLNIVKTCVAKGAIDYKEGNLYKKQAANRIIAHMVNYTNSAIGKGLKKTPFDPRPLTYRPPNLHESALEQHVIYRLLKINNSFSTPINQVQL